jgi:hypothetical protein
VVETVWAPLRLSLTAEWVMETNTNADDAAASGDTTALARVKGVCDMLKAEAEIVEAELLAIAMWGMLDGARNEYARLLNLPAAPQPLDRAVDDINADTSIAAMQGVAVRRLVPLHRGSDRLNVVHRRSGRCSGSTSNSMLRAILGFLLMNPARSSVNTIW